MPDKFYDPQLEEAHKIIGHIDKDDVAYIALALSLDADGIWTYDPHLGKQNKIETFSTSNLLFLIRNGIV
ncbi:MAG: hypothetical protein KGH72_03645 [Candidatus Micrarchaeota archaeon]|nr:hypothetical protein [Candidatus Micrarchaeota archaeon]